ncbi:MAG: RES family NAD+ phosphorylase [Verrucomicrobiae bacterium]|nr:RES family NAD+ phosphorylase [Verrucomicrobiae bacterium]
MPLVHHPQFEPLQRRIAAGAEAIQEWDGRVFRCVELPWARPAYLVSGNGTRQHGGRWIEPGVTEVVHAATTEALSLKESRGVFAYYGIRRPGNTPRVSVELELRLGRVLNLARGEGVLAPIHVEELLREDWRKLNQQGRETLGQALGRAAWAVGLEGMLVPSARDRRARNLVWFPGNLESGSRCTIVGERELARWIADVPADVQKSD